jgi:3-deoxy-D-manno-octulosonic-acid transferase
MSPGTPAIGYRLLGLLLYPFWILHAIRHGVRHGLPGYLPMRLFGFASPSREQVWVHASSVGEVRAVTPLVEALLETGEDILFTSFTATGCQAIRRQFSASVSSGVIPVDVGWSCARFFRRHRIKLGLIVETELWPELLYQARRQHISLLLINARLSEKSLRSGRFARGILRTALDCFEQILARNNADRDALLELGAGVEKIAVVGNLKSHRKAAAAPARLIERDYLILASSHTGEERQFLAGRPPGFAELLLVLAPRHPSRRAEIETGIQQLGMKYAVRSRAEPIAADTEVYLADTLGELGSLMAHARIVIMGGSFDDTGGHNLIEPASLGCAIITGPSDANIADDIAMLGPGSGVLQVADISACWRSIVDLLDHPRRASALGQEARERLARQPDVIEQYLAEIRPFL